MWGKPETEATILRTLLALGGTASIEDVVSVLDRLPGLSVEDFRRTAGLEPNWVTDVRKAHQSLKDQGCLAGLESGTWWLTPRGLSRVQNNPNWTSAVRVLREITVTRRDNVQGIALKQLYDFRCQVCGDRIDGGPGSWVAEAHHLRPVGHPHQGPDVLENMLVLCPNHHVQFDRGVLAINPETKMVESYRNETPPRALAVSRHELGGEFIMYHWRQIYVLSHRSS